MIFIFLILKQSESIIEDIIRKAMNHERIFKLRAKAEQYNVIFNFKKSLTILILF